MGDQMVGRTLVGRALGWLAHPVSLGAVLVMALNDHVLKAEFGTWWTGKLSDVAGLVFFPAVVAVVLAFVMPGSARPASADAFRRLVVVATAVTGVGFAWVKATESGASIASELLSAISGPGVILADTTDLLALPALGLAVWVGLGVTARRRHHHALTVAALPLALLASVATTSPDDPPVPGIVVDDAGMWLMHVEDAFGYEGNAYYTYTGEGWKTYYESGTGEPAPANPMPFWHQDVDCVPSRELVCFRVLRGSTGVEISNDAGVTWEVDWALTADEVATLREAYGLPPHDFATVGVGVFEMPRGFVVVASNGTDGFAVRGVDGTWERVGFAGMDCCDSLETVDFATVDELPEERALPLGLAMGVGLSTLGLPLLAALLRWGRQSWIGGGTTFVGLVFSVIAAVSGLNVLGGNVPYAPLSRESTDGRPYDYAMLGLFCLIAAVAAAACFGLLRRGAVWATVLGWALGAAVAGVAAELAPDEQASQVLASLLALAVWTALYVPVARRFLVRYVQPPQRPRDP